MPKNNHTTPQRKKETDTFKNLLASSVTVGQSFDLSDCCYGPPTGNGIAFNSKPMPYYFFLAGLAFRINATKILEVGTHYAGGTLSFLKGMEAGSDSKNLQIVTIDTNAIARESIKNENRVELVLGEAQQKETITKALGFFESNELDILFIDALKSAEFVCEVITQVAIQGVTPKYIILDDISANKSMKQLWKNLHLLLKNKAVLASKIDGSLRNKSTDMALLDLSEYSKEIMEEIGYQYIPHRVAQSNLKQSGYTMKTASISESHLFRTNPSELTNSIKLDGIRKSEAYAIFTLISQYFQDIGQIVTIRDEGPGISSLIIEALETNKHIANKSRRLNLLSPAFDPFGKNGISDSALPLININEISADQLRLPGENIELAVIGQIQTQKQLSNVLSEILAFSIPKTTYILLRNCMVHYRLWVVTTLAMLRDFIELKATDGRSLIFKLTRPIPLHKLRYVSTYNFTINELDSNLEALAALYTGTMIHIDLLLQLGWLRNQAGRHASAEKICDKIESSIDLDTMSLRSKRLKDLREKLKLEKSNNLIFSKN